MQIIYYTRIYRMCTGTHKKIIILFKIQIFQVRNEQRYCKVVTKIPCFRNSNSIFLKQSYDIYTHLIIKITIIILIHATIFYGYTYVFFYIFNVNILNHIIDEKRSKFCCLCLFGLSRGYSKWF